MERHVRPPPQRHPRPLLKFFADRGHKQVIATYYDDPSLESTQRWLATAKGHPSVEGFMYTTWTNNYEHIEKFAEACRAK